MTCRSVLNLVQDIVFYPFGVPPFKRKDWYSMDQSGVMQVVTCCKTGFTSFSDNLFSFYRIGFFDGYQTHMAV